MIEEGIMDNLEANALWSYMGELMSSDAEVQKLRENPEKMLQEKLGISISRRVSVKEDYRALTEEERKVLSSVIKADIQGELSNDFLNTASNRLAVLIAVAAVAAAAWLVLWLVGPD